MIRPSCCISASTLNGSAIELGSGASRPPTRRLTTSSVLRPRFAVPCYQGPGNVSFLPTRKSQPAARFIDSLKLSLLTRSSRFLQRGHIARCSSLSLRRRRQIRKPLYHVCSPLSH